MVRNLESKIDSTPFLEGSCMMWRKDALQIDALHITSNADDAQIATNIRINGLRVIQDSDAYFIDNAPIERSEHSRQKVRRAQGLQRHLLRTKEALVQQTSWSLCGILRQEAALHLLTPLFLFGTFVAMLARWASIGFADIDFSNATLTTLHVSLFTAEAVALLAWLSVRYRIKIPATESNRFHSRWECSTSSKHFGKAHVVRHFICGINIWMVGIEKKKKAPPCA